MYMVIYFVEIMNRRRYWYIISTNLSSVLIVISNKHQILIRDRDRMVGRFAPTYSIRPYCSSISGMDEIRRFIPIITLVLKY